MNTRKKFQSYWLLAIFVLTLMACSKNDEPEVDPIVDPIEEPDLDQPLKEKAGFGIGAAVTTAQLNESDFVSTLSENFSQITGEYEMKMAHIWKSSSSYDWSKADALVDFAKQHNMKVHGHTLLWYKSFPDWFKAADYDSLTFENKIKEYITTTVSRYKDDVASWDVANEIFNDNGTLRIDETIYETFTDPIAFYGRCFQYARDADSDALLFYNDYNVVTANGKRYAIKKMVERFQEEGYPIDGLGEQFHYSVSTSQSTIKTGLDDLATTGLKIHISELDMKVNVNKSDSYTFSSAEQQKQADAYQSIVESYEALPDDQKFAITTWGVTDKYTWLTDSWHEKEYPLLFDKNYEKKKAYEGFLLGLK